VWKDPRYGPAILWLHDLAILFKDAFLGYSVFFITGLDTIGNGFYKADIVTNIKSGGGGIKATHFNLLEDGRTYIVYMHQKKSFSSIS
jgi:hypothetical protein